MDNGNIEKVPLQLSQGCIVASIQIDLTEDVLREFRADILHLLHTSGVTGIILDLSGVEVLDLGDFEDMSKTIEMAGLMGAKTVVSGLKPGVVSALGELGAETEEITAAMNLDDAFKMITEPETSDTDTMEQFLIEEPEDQLILSEDDVDDPEDENTFTNQF